MMKCETLNIVVEAPRLTEDDAFNSNTAMGFITYRLPAIDKLLGVPMTVLDSYPQIIFELYLVVNHDLFEPFEDHCGNKKYCLVYYRKMYSPIVYTLSPPVVYF